MGTKTEAGHIKVQIFGQSYNVRGEEDKAYIEELARYVDGKMKALAESTGAGDSLKVAILAALNLADELFKLERRERQTREELVERVGALTRRLEEGFRVVEGDFS
jgi:cell division protein ZapA